MPYMLFSTLNLSLLESTSTDIVQISGERICRYYFGSHWVVVSALPPSGRTLIYGTFANPDPLVSDAKLQARGFSGGQSMLSMLRAPLSILFP